MVFSLLDLSIFTTENTVSRTAKQVQSNHIEPWRFFGLSRHLGTNHRMLNGCLEILDAPPRLSDFLSCHVGSVFG